MTGAKSLPGTFWTWRDVRCKADVGRAARAVRRRVFLVGVVREFFGVGDNRNLAIATHRNVRSKKWVNQRHFVVRFQWGQKALALPSGIEPLSPP